MDTFIPLKLLSSQQQIRGLCLEVKQLVTDINIDIMLHLHMQIDSVINRQTDRKGEWEM